MSIELDSFEMIYPKQTVLPQNKHLMAFFVPGFPNPPEEILIRDRKKCKICGYYSKRPRIAIIEMFESWGKNNVLILCRKCSLIMDPIFVKYRSKTKQILNYLAEGSIRLSYENIMYITQDEEEALNISHQLRLPFRRESLLKTNPKKLLELVSGNEFDELVDKMKAQYISDKLQEEQTYATK